MPKPIHLTIPQPCHENWNRMGPAEKGKFCNACAKQVVDFTPMSDAQLAAFFKKPSTGAVCGRFMRDQLDRDLPIPRKRIPWVRYFFQIAIPAFLTASKLAAQQPVKRTDIVMVAPGDTKGRVALSSSEHIISGRIIDAEKNGIAYARVMIDGTDVSTTTDSLGHFRLAYSRPKKKVKVTVSSVGYEQRTEVVRLGKGSGSIREVEWALQQHALGEVVVVGAVAW